MAALGTPFGFLGSLRVFHPARWLDLLRGIPSFREVVIAFAWGLGLLVALLSLATWPSYFAISLSVGLACLRLGLRQRLA